MQVIFPVKLPIHLSRTCVAQKIYAEAINCSQRALVLSRSLAIA